MLRFLCILSLLLFFGSMSWSWNQSMKPVVNGDDDGDAPVVGGMILQNVELAQHGVVHKVHLTLYLVIDDVDDDHSCFLVTIYNILWKSVCLESTHLMATTRFVQHIGNVVPETVFLSTPYEKSIFCICFCLEAITSGKRCLETASHWNSCQPFSEELQKSSIMFVCVFQYHS